MPRLIRSGQNISQVLRNKVARAGFGPNFYTRLMPAKHAQVLADQGLADVQAIGLMPAGQYISQGLRSTLR